MNLFLIWFSEHEDDDEYSSNGQASPGHADDPECEASKGLSKKIENLEENNADNLSRHEAMISIYRGLQIKVKPRDVFEIGDIDDDADDGEDDNDDDVEHTDGTHMYSLFSPRITQQLVAPEINILMEPLDANLQSYDGNLQSYDQSTARSPITGMFCRY